MKSTMKTEFNKLTKSIRKILFYGLLVSVLLTVASCSNDDNDEQIAEVPKALNNEVITVPFFVQNENGDMPSSDADLLYEFRLNNPVLDRDGNHLTWADFGTVSGTASVTCLEGGFEISMELTGLIPNGVYTFWNVTFNEGGMNTNMEMLNIRGIGCIGAIDGSENYFIASGDGTGSISAFTQSPADLSMIGDILSCPITDEIEFHIVGAYHLDSKTWGPNLGPDGTAVEQFGFIFKQ
jgi:hypothetical protein